MNKLILVSLVLFFSTTPNALSAKTPPMETTACTTSVQSVFDGTLQVSPTETVKYNLENWTEKNEDGEYIINQQEARATITAVVSALGIACNLPTLGKLKGFDITVYNKKGVTPKELDFIEVSGQTEDSIMWFKAYGTGKLVLDRIPSVKERGRDLVKNKNTMTLEESGAAIVEALPPELKIITKENIISLNLEFNDEIRVTVSDPDGLIFDSSSHDLVIYSDGGITAAGFILNSPK